MVHCLKDEEERIASLESISLPGHNNTVTHADSQELLVKCAATFRRSAAVWSDRSPEGLVHSTAAALEPSLVATQQNGEKREMISDK